MAKNIRISTTRTRRIFVRIYFHYAVIAKTMKRVRGEVPVWRIRIRGCVFIKLSACIGSDLCLVRGSMGK